MRTVRQTAASAARPGAARCRVALLLLANLTIPVLGAAIGCSARTCTFEIVDHREPGEAQRYAERFDEAYFNLDKYGNVDIVLRRTTPTEYDPRQPITQIIHLHTVWRSIPGETVAHRTQINATVTYHIVAGRTGATFEGAGSVFFTLDRDKGKLTGRLDLARLQPKRQLASGGDLFRRAELSGRFQATRNPRRAVRIINEMNRLFGAGSSSNP